MLATTVVSCFVSHACFQSALSYTPCPKEERYLITIIIPTENSAEKFNFHLSAFVHTIRRG